MITGNEKAKRILERLEACKSARLFAQNLSIKVAWETCPRGEWLFWVTRQLNVGRKSMVRAACACARLALPFVEKGESRPLQCIEVIERWCKGKATIKEVRKASDASFAAAVAAAAAARDAAHDYAAAARAASSHAAFAASFAAYAAVAARDAAHDYAYAAARAATTADAAYARTRMEQQTAYAVRSVIPWATIKTALNKLDL